MADISPTRRALLGAMAFAPVVIAAPTIAGASFASGQTPFSIVYARYVLARDELNNASHLEATDRDRFDALEDRYLDADSDLDDASPTNWQEFAQKLEHCIGDLGNQRNDDLIADAKRLANATA